MFHNDAITNLILEIQRPVCSLTSIHFARSVFKMFLVIQSVSEMILASLKREFPSTQAFKPCCTLFYLCRHIPKDQFKSAKNDVLEPEPFIDCEDCGRSLHQVCVLHFDQISRQ